MNENITLKISEFEKDERLDSFLSKELEALSRSQVQKLIKSGNITVNSHLEKSSYKLRANDKITLIMPENDEKIKPQNIDLDIQYEDESMLVVNKPKDMLTHPTALEKENTLVNALLYHYGENLSDVNGEMRRGIVHRLDRNTSGLLMVAKTNDAHNFLAETIKTKTAKRKYLAIVSGNLDFDTKTIDLPIGRCINRPYKQAVIEEGKPSVTHLKVLKRFKGFTFVELELSTGRTHQIRVHLSHLGYPIVNDSLYGGKKIPVNTLEQVLQSYHLTFQSFSDRIIHNIDLVFADYMQRTLNYLEGL